MTTATTLTRRLIWTDEGRVGGPRTHRIYLYSDGSYRTVTTFAGSQTWDDSDTRPGAPSVYGVWLRNQADEPTSR